MNQAVKSEESMLGYLEVSNMTKNAEATTNSLDDQESIIQSKEDGGDLEEIKHQDSIYDTAKSPKLEAVKKDIELLYH